MAARLSTSGPSVCEEARRRSQGQSVASFCPPYSWRPRMPSKMSPCVVRDTLVSVPYVDLTLDIMARFGVEVINDGYRHFMIRGQQCYTGQDYLVEGDASSATYFWGLAALLGQSMCVTNVPPTSAQGDVRFLDVLERMGCTVSRGARLQVTGPTRLQPLGAIDLNALPDAAMTVAVLAAFCQGTTRLCNVANLRVKETDRLRALATELRKLGVAVTEFPDGLQIDGNPEALHGAEIATYDDHRMAMCFGMAGARLPGIRIQEPSVCGKNLPRILGGSAARWGPGATGVNDERDFDGPTRYRQKQCG